MSRLQIHGAGDVKADGDIDSLVIELHGQGDVRAKNLKSKHLQVHIQGAGDVKAYASQSADIQISGAGDVEVYGNPAKRNSRVRGSGDIKWKQQ